MRTPFVRPLLSVIFYVFAGLTFAGYLLLGLALMIGSALPLSMKAYAGAGASITMGIAAIVAGAMAGGILVAIGQFIELIAKIEWNTRPKTDEMGYAVEPAACPSTTAMTDKQYYVSDKGRLTGPLNAHEVLALYRDGRISISAQVSVEENGQRRLLKNLSELGL